MDAKPFDTILVANRGEIAVRVLRTARAMGYRTVAVYSEADADAPHVRLADQAVCIGPAAASESYLRIEKIIDAAQKTGAGAVHPGYGFLSENSNFSKACAQAGIVFIGPPEEAIELMGSKRLSKLAMIEAGVPCVPGYEGDDQSDERLIAEAGRIGFPLMVKASEGGGGRGMRLVHEEAALADSIRSARTEARNAFGSDELILERAVISPRHIEIQVFADAHGNVIHLGERDCSVQRRHQKVIEEAPSPFVSADMRARMGAAAVEAARACNYRGAGTVEFLADNERNFYFLEMNTRLQVEHPVTELVTGQDLVAWQIDVAAGKPLPLTQDEVSLNGWAIEARLYAEDPRNNFMPQTGRIVRWQPAEGPGMRIDGGIREGQNVTPYYDPMVAKIIAYGSNRDEARRRLVHAIENSLLLGVTNNKAFLAGILNNAAFAAGEATTAFLDTHFSGHQSTMPSAPSLSELGLAAALMLAKINETGGRISPRTGWSNAAPVPWPCRIECEGETYKLQLSAVMQDGGLHCTAKMGDKTETFELIQNDGDRCQWMSGGVRHSADYAFNGATLWLDGAAGGKAFLDVTQTPPDAAGTSGSGRIIAPMDGAVIEVLVAAGDRVERGQVLAKLEAMKMEHRLTADVDGIVADVAVSQGDQVKMRQLLVTITGDESAHPLPDAR